MEEDIKNVKEEETKISGSNKAVELSTVRSVLFWIFYIPFTFFGGAALSVFLSDSFMSLMGREQMIGAAWIISCLTNYQSLKQLFAECNWKNFMAFLALFAACMLGCVVWFAAYIISCDYYGISGILSSIIGILCVLVVAGVIYVIAMCFGFTKRNKEALNETFSNQPSIKEVETKSEDTITVEDSLNIPDSPTEATSNAKDTETGNDKDASKKEASKEVEASPTMAGSIIKMSFTEGVINGFKKITTFKGRARRKEFCSYLIAIYVIDILLISIITAISTLTYADIKYYAGFIFWLLMISVFVRRMHDIGWSGWVYFILFILNTSAPIISGILSNSVAADEMQADSLTALFTAIFALPTIVVVLMLAFCDGNQMPNKYGLSPKYRQYAKGEDMADEPVIETDKQEAKSKGETNDSVTEIKETRRIIKRHEKARRLRPLMLKLPVWGGTDVGRTASTKEKLLYILKNRLKHNYTKFKLNFNLNSAKLKSYMRFLILIIPIVACILLITYFMLFTGDRDKLGANVYIEMTSGGRVLHTDKHCPELHKAIYIQWVQLNEDCYYCTKCVSDKQAEELNAIIKQNKQEATEDDNGTSNTDDVEDDIGGNSVYDLPAEDDEFDDDEGFETDFDEY